MCVSLDRYGLHHVPHPTQIPPVIQESSSVDRNRMFIAYLAPIRIEQPQTNAPYTQISSHHNNHRTIMNTKPSAMRRQSTANTATHRTIHFKYRIVIDLFLYFYLTFTLVILDKSRKNEKKKKKK
eukprot:839466_1